MVIDSTSRLIAEALLNGIWQGLVIAIVAEGAAHLLRGRVAHLRHALWFAAFMLIVLLPPLHLMSTRGDGLGSIAAIAASTSTAPLAALVTAELATSNLWILPDRVADGITGLFLLLSLVGSLRVIALLASLRRLRSLKLTSSPLPPGLEMALADLLRRYGCRKARIRVSHEVSTPSTVGFLFPVVLLPAALLTALDEDEWSHIVVHELAHVRRYDDWANLVQRILEQVFFYLPAVVWAGRRLEFQRELACDEFAALWCGSGRAYARCLTRVAETARRDSLLLAPGATARGGQLSRRVATLLTPAPPRGRWMGTRLAFGGVAIASVAVGLQLLPQISFATGRDWLSPPVAATLPVTDAWPEQIAHATDSTGGLRTVTRPVAGDVVEVRHADSSKAMPKPVDLREPEIRVVEICAHCAFRPRKTAMAPVALSKRPPGAVRRPTQPLPPRGGWATPSTPVRLSIRVGSSAMAAPMSASQPTPRVSLRQRRLPGWLTVDVRTGPAWPVRVPTNR